MKGWLGGPGREKERERVLKGGEEGSTSLQARNVRGASKGCVAISVVEGEKVRQDGTDGICVHVLRWYEIVDGTGRWGSETLYRA